MPRVNKKFLLLCLLPSTLLMVVVMAKTGATLKGPATPNGIIDLEFAYTGTKAAGIINSWAKTAPINNVRAARINTWLDFIFLFFYALLLYNACKLVAEHFAGPLFRFGQILAKGALVAGICDVLENAGMLLVLYGHILDALTLLTVIFSLIKWMLVCAAVLYISMGGLFLLYKKVRNPGGIP